MADDLSYTYELGNKSNRLKNVADPMGDEKNVSDYVVRSTGDYGYDANGNMTTDPGKGTTIAYNYLKLPECVTFSPVNKIFYFYDAAGRKLAQMVESDKSDEDKRTDYVGGTVYTDEQPSFAATEEGRLVPDGQGGWRHEYYLKDHLGNTRAVVAGTLIPGGADLLQTTSYYPFGLSMAQTDYNNEATNYRKNRYLYNGKELQSDGFGGVELGWLDYGARFYDPAGVRWTTIDPLAEKYNSMTPYAYCAGNPILFIDKDGREIWLSYVHESDGQSVNVQYKAGALYNADGSKYSGGNPYFKEVAVQLNQLHNVSEDVTGVLNTLEKSENKHTITNFDAAYPDAEGNQNRAVNVVDDGLIKGITEAGNTISKYDPNATETTSGDKRNPKVGLIHELKHAFDREQGGLRKGTTKTGVENCEVDAVNVENQVRETTGDPKRISYGGVAIPEEDLK